MKKDGTDGSGGSLGVGCEAVDLRPAVANRIDRVKQRAAANRVRIVDLLNKTGREGMAGLIEWLIKSGYFESPASTKYHGSYEGGLAQHSLNVLERLYVLTGRAVFQKARYAPSAHIWPFVTPPVPLEALVIAALLHDVCKVGAYLPVESEKWKVAGVPEYRWNKEHPKGHARLSIEIITRFIELTEIEELMIRYHMGVYGLNEFEPGKGEYPLRGGGLANAWHHHPIVKLMYFADELATLDEKADERRER